MVYRSLFWKYAIAKVIIRGKFDIFLVLKV
jgi:hypothetical protein